MSARKTAGPDAATTAALLDRPFQRAFDRRGGGVDIVAIEAKACLQPQTVARAQPDRQHVTVRKQRFREPFGVLGRNRNLEPVLAGVARTRDEAIYEIGRASCRER